MDIFCDSYYNLSDAGKTARTDPRGAGSFSIQKEEILMKAFHEVRSYDSDFMVWQSSYQDISFLAHWHQEIELIYVRSGAARIRVADDEFTAHSGDLVIVDTGDFHNSSSYEYRNHLDFIIFDPSIISPRYRHSNFSSPLVTAAQLAQYGMTEAVRDLFSEVTLELREKKPFYQEIVSAALCSFFYRLRRCHPCVDDPDTARSHRMAMLYDMQQLLTYIDEHYSENITLSFAAQKMNFSESHFSRIFKRVVGLNFVTYLNAVRLEQAVTLLKSTAGKISDIALACGFENIRSFNRTFKEYTGYTPTQFLRLPDAEAQHFSYYRHKSSREEHVQDDSLTVVWNGARGSLT